MRSTGEKGFAPDEGRTRNLYGDAAALRSEESRGGAPKLKRASLTTLFESVEASEAANAVSRSVCMPVREKSFCPSDWFCDSS